jgi:uncharacterized protein YqgQ
VSKVTTLYDVQQLLKKFNVYVYVGKRIWDIELMAIELDHLYAAKVIEQKLYIKAKMVLEHEHRLEVEKAAKQKKEN